MHSRIRLRTAQIKQIGTQHHAVQIATMRVQISVGTTQVYKKIIQGITVHIEQIQKRTLPTQKHIIPKHIPKIVFIQVKQVHIQVKQVQVKQR